MLSHRGRRNVSFSEKDAYNCLAKLGYNDAPQVGGQVETVYRMFMETHGIVYEKDAEQYDFTRKDYETPPKVNTSREIEIETRLLLFTFFAVYLLNR